MTGAKKSDDLNYNWEIDFDVQLPKKPAAAGPSRGSQDVRSGRRDRVFLFRLSAAFEKSERGGNRRERSQHDQRRSNVTPRAPAESVGHQEADAGREEGASADDEHEFGQSEIDSFHTSPPFPGVAISSPSRAGGKMIG